MTFHPAASDRAILWHWPGGPSTEDFRLRQTAGGWRLAGTVVTGEEGQPALITYQVDVDLAWCTRQVAVAATLGTSEPIQIRLRAAPDGSWHAERHPEPAAPWLDPAQLTGLIDIDLAFTPATNTLPLRRLRPAIGETIAVTTVWLRYPGLVIEPAPQTYQRLDPHRYRFTSDNGAFTAVIAVDDAGLVTDYEGLWRRVATSG